MTNRNFYRCLHCCKVVAIDAPTPEKKIGWNGTGYKVHVPPYCDCGGGKWAAENRSSMEWMGKVEGNYVIKVEDRCPCDSRCTHAVGPHCDCVCGGANHGTHAVVPVVTNVQGIPHIVTTDLMDRLIAVAEFEELAAAVKKFVDADPGVINLRKHVWIKDRAEWERAYNLTLAVGKARKLKTMAGRMKALNKIINVKEIA
jgi:hypothetical protein